MVGSSGLTPEEYACTSGIDEETEIDGRLSFPSGHSSMSMMSGMWVQPAVCLFPAA
jgi:hypothetical protein